MSTGNPTNGFAPQGTTCSPAMSSPDLLKRSKTIPSTGVQGASLIRRQFTRRKPKKVPTSTSTTDSAYTSRHSTGTDQKIVVNVDEVLETVYLAAESFVADEEDLDYDSLSAYFVVRYEERVLVTQEIERLAVITASPETPLVFTRGQRLGGGNARGYHALTTPTKRLLRAKTICALDNDGIGLVYAPLGHNPQRFMAMLNHLRPSESPVEPPPDRVASAVST